MDAGQTVYRAYIGDRLMDEGGVFSMVYTGTVTEIVADGEPLVRSEGGQLWKSSDGWHATREAAQQHVIAVLVQTVRGIYRQIDTIRSELRNEVAA